MDINSLIKDNKFNEFIRFVFVGVFATAIHYGTYSLLQLFNIPYNIAFTLGYFVSFIFNYFASNYFTFKTTPNKQKGFKFAIAHVFNYFFQMLLLNIYIYVGINKDIAPFFVFLVAVPTNFIFVRFALKSK
ncbi:MAG: GtrA family protein [Clostridiaceae bacterium]